MTNSLLERMTTTMPKKNSFLAQRDAQKEAEHKQRLRCLSEIHIMAMMISAHNKLQVGPGRAPDLLAEYVNVKAKIAQDIQNDIGDSHKKNGQGDPEFLYTKKDLAITLKKIFGREMWPHFREFFPMLEQYWDVEV